MTRISRIYGQAREHGFSNRQDTGLVLKAMIWCGDGQDYMSDVSENVFLRNWKRGRNTEIAVLRFREKDMQMQTVFQWQISDSPEVLVPFALDFSGLHKRTSVAFKKI